MKNFAIAFCIFLVWSFFGLWLYSWVANDTLAETALNTTTTEVVTIKDSLNHVEIAKPNKQKNNVFAIMGLDSTEIASYDSGFVITKNSNVIKTSPTLDYQYKIASYLVQNPSLNVFIHSTYAPTENYEIPNYGIQRGTFIKNQLIKVGIEPERIHIKPRIKEINFDENNQFYNGVTFSFIEETDVLEQEIDTDITLNKTIYPKFSNTGILINKELQDLLQYVKGVLENKPFTKIEIVGHTDNVGNSIDNYRQGLEYARQVRWYLVTKGNIDKNSITALSKGEEEPIDTNGTERGRNTNRRIEVIFINE